MLDELKELQLYTFDAGNVKAFPRSGTMIRPVNKGRKNAPVYEFSSIPRAFELIARHCLYHGSVSEEQAATRAADAVRVLRDWCGFARRDEEIPSIPGMEYGHRWMKRFIKTYSKLAPEFDAKELTRAWNGRKAAYEEGLFTDRALRASDINALSYEACVARALRKGPLRSMVLVGKLEPHDVCTTDDRKANGSFKKVDVRNSPTIITFMALCLKGLGCAQGVPTSGFVPVNMQDLRLWLGRNKEFDHRVLKSWLYHGEQLFMQDSEESGVRSWKVNQAWLDDGQWQLIDITQGNGPLREFCREHAGEGFRCYRDADYEAPDFEMGPFKKLVAFACDELEGD